MYPNQPLRWPPQAPMQTQTTTTPNQISNPLGTINPQQLQQFKMAWNVLQNSSNPTMMIQNMLMQNPNLKNIMSLLQGGQNPRDLFAQYTGIDPDAFLKALQQQ